MKEKINQLVDKYQKTLSDSSSKTLKLMKMKAFLPFPSLLEQLIPLRKTLVAETTL